MAHGDEILIVDGSDRDREGLRKLFDLEGYVCTAVGTFEDAREMIDRKFYPAALVDLDTGGAGRGLEVVRYLRERSKQTAVVLVTGRRAFEAAVEALRLGAVDVIVKRPEEVAQMRRAIAVATDRYRASDKEGDLIRDVKSVLDDAFKIMLAMGRRIYAEASIQSVASGPQKRPLVLVVDEDQQFLGELAQLLADKPWDVAVEMNGGAALDKASDHAFDVVATRDFLVDLPGATLVKTLQAQREQTSCLVYTAPGPSGHIDRYDDGRLQEGERPFKGPKQLANKIGELVAEKQQLVQERKYLQAFRGEHGDFLKRYAELKSRIDSMAAK